MNEKEIEVTKTRHDITTFKARIKASRSQLSAKGHTQRTKSNDALEVEAEELA